MERIAVSDSTLTSGENVTKSTLQTKPALKEFLAHCCVQRKYMFQVKKCGSLTCSMCKPPQLPAEVFNRLKYMPDPVPGEEGHYKPFTEVYGTSTTEQYVPSMMRKTQRKKTLPFASNLRHVRNVDMMLGCLVPARPRDYWGKSLTRNIYASWSGLISIFPT